MSNWENVTVRLTDEHIVEAYNTLGDVKLKVYQKWLKDTYGIERDKTSIMRRIAKLKNTGEIALASGVSVEKGTVLTGVSRYHKLEDGGVWVKSDVEKTKQIESIKKGIEEFYEGFTSKHEIIRPPEMTHEDLLTFYPMPDPHWGLLTHGEELQHGHNFDLKIQEKWVLGAMKYLVDTALPTKHCVITDLGDLLHSMDDKKQTKSGHNLDVDGRTHKIVKVMFNAYVQLVNMALTKHETVEIYSVAGNHSDMAGLYLKAHLAAWYRNEPRVIIVESEKSQQYKHFEKCILGFSHGHELRPSNAGEVLVADNMEIISSTEHRYFHFGHYHHDQKDKSYPLCEVEIHCNNLPRDKWADSQGYRGKLGEAKSILYHKEHGEMSRNRFNINMIGLDPFK
jgi:hypothetical protein